MQKFIKSLSCCFCWILVIVSPVWALNSQREQLVAFDAIVAELETHYGMLEYKKDLFGIRLNDLAREYRQMIRSGQTLEEARGLRPATSRRRLSPDEFRQLMIGFAAEFRDGHFNILRQSSGGSTVGIRTYAIEDRLYVGDLDPDLFVSGLTNPPVERGDEIVSVDDRPVQQIARENLLYTHQLGGTLQAAQARALRVILNVPHALMREKPEGQPVRIAFRKPGTTETFSGEFRWIHTESLQEARWISQHLTASLPNRTLPRYVWGDTSRPETPFSEGLRQLGLPLGAVQDVTATINQLVGTSGQARTDSLTPRIAAGVEPTLRLPAYVLRLAGKNIGVLRIPNYSPENIVNELRWLGVALEYFENSVDLLIIDQMSNGGGSVFHAWQFLKFFATGILETGTIDVRLSETLLNVLEQRLPSDGGTSPDGRPQNFGRLQHLRHALQDLRTRMENGDRMSGPVSGLMGDLSYLRGRQGQIVGDPNQTFTKPLLVLNDQYSGSGGDFVPWLLQSNGRALVLGETSSGLGGPVYRTQTSMPGSQLTMRCTFGLCRDGQGRAVENLGVVPNLRRPIAEEDVRSGFRFFSDDVLQSALLLLQGENTFDIGQWLEARQLQRRASPGQLLQQITQLRSVFTQQLQDSGTDLQRQLQVYRDLFNGIAQWPTPAVARLRWEDLRFPIPDWLTSADPILATLVIIPEQRSRLSEIRNRPSWSPEQKSFIDYLVTEFGNIQRRREPPSQCTSLFN